MTDNQELDVEHAFVRTQDTENYEPDTKPRQREVQAIRDNCRAGEALNTDCAVVAASEEGGQLKVKTIQYVLDCGCILISKDSDEVF